MMPLAIQVVAWLTIAKRTVLCVEYCGRHCHMFIQNSCTFICTGARGTHCMSRERARGLVPACLTVLEVMTGLCICITAASSVLRNKVFVCSIYRSEFGRPRVVSILYALWEMHLLTGSDKNTTSHSSSQVWLPY